MNRIQQLAQVFIEHSLAIKQGDKLVISASDLSAIELIKESYRLALRKGAQVYLDIYGNAYLAGRADYGGLFNVFIEESTYEHLDSLNPISELVTDWGNKHLRIVSLHNRNHLAAVDADKLSIWNKTISRNMRKLIDKDWVLTYYPTIGTAQNADMSFTEFEDFYYQACLVDYKKLDAEIKPLEMLLDEATEIEIKGNNIDLRFSIAERLSMGVDSGKHNVPDGECFVGPVEDSVNGSIKFEYPQIYQGKEVNGIYLEFESGKVINFSADTNQVFLEKLLNSDPDNRRLGEFGIGMNKMITRYIKDILFDEKIYGTVHFALGTSYNYERGGGKNKGNIHWDMIKDLRHLGSSMTADGKVFFRDGEVII